MRDGYRMQRTVQLALPEFQELGQGGKARRLVIALPDVGLQKPRVIGHAVEDARGGQPVTHKQLPSGIRLLHLDPPPTPGRPGALLRAGQVPAVRLPSVGMLAEPAVIAASSGVQTRARKSG